MFLSTVAIAHDRLRPLPIPRPEPDLNITAPPRIMTQTSLNGILCFDQTTTTGRVDHLNRDRRRVLWVACGAQALHDGFTDTLYLLLPIWQAEFALGYAAIGILRALYAGVMAGLQVPVAKLAQRIGGAAILAVGTAGAAAAYLFLGASSSVAILAAALILGGVGSSTQHPIASNLVATAYQGPRSRGALGTYNFAGDLGKMALPSITAGLIAVMSWRSAASTVGMIGLAGAVTIGLLLRHMPLASADRTDVPSAGMKTYEHASLPHGGFRLLLAIGILDSATRMGFLTFCRFCCGQKVIDALAAGPRTGYGSGCLNTWRPMPITNTR